MANGSFVRDWSQVVGVVGHIKLHTLMAEVRPQIYMPFLQTMPPRLQMTYPVRRHRQATFHQGRGLELRLQLRTTK